MTEQHSLWELIAAVDGFNRANATEEQIEPMSDAQFDALLSRRGQG